MCRCEFDADPDSDDENTPETTWHYRRTCRHCGQVWWGLHCPHDGTQKPCPSCGTLPTPEPDDDGGPTMAVSAWKRGYPPCDPRVERDWQERWEIWCSPGGIVWHRPIKR